MWVNINDRIPLFDGNYLFKNVTSEGEVYYMRLDFNNRDKFKLLRDVRGRKWEFSLPIVWGQTLEWWDPPMARNDDRAKIFKLNLNSILNSNPNEI
jgi:hypothetical protein